MRAVWPSCAGAAAAPHAVSGGGEGGAARAAGGEGEGRGVKGAGGGWRGGAHIVFGLKVGALGDEVVEAVELAVPSRRHEGRESVLRKARRRRHTRSAAAARAGQQGAAGGEGRRGLGAAGGEVLTQFAAFTSTPFATRRLRVASFATRRLRVARSPFSAASIRASSACGRSHPPSAHRESQRGACAWRGEPGCRFRATASGEGWPRAGDGLGRRVGPSVSKRGCLGAGSQLGLRRAWYTHRRGVAPAAVASPPAGRRRPEAGRNTYGD